MLKKLQLNMKKVIKGIGALSMAAMLSLDLGGNLACAVNADFDTSVRVDSNSWTQMAKKAKTTDNSYAAMVVTTMWEASGSSASHGAVADYTKIYGRMSVDGTNAIKTVCSGGTYKSDKGGVLLTKGTKGIFLLKDNMKITGTVIKVCLMGNDPAKDCFAAGHWNIDRPDGDD